MLHICRNCDHPEANHPNRFLCDMQDCTCPGWVKLVDGINT